MSPRKRLGAAAAAALLAGIGGFIVINPLNFNTPANQFYVATTGNDTNPGTQASPWLTITKAGNTVGAGATVHVASGTYGVSTINNSGNSAARTTYISDAPYGAVVTTNSTSAYPITVLGDYVTVQGFDVTATLSTVGIAGEGNHDWVIGNRIHNIGDTGACQHGGGAIDMFAASGVYADQNDSLVVGNLIYNTSQTSCRTSGFTIHGIYGTSSGFKAYSNIVGHIEGYGIHCWHACNAPIVSGNTVFNSGSGGILVGTGDSGVIPVFDNAVMTDNTSINNLSYGLREYSYDAAHMGTNNKWWNNNTFGNSVGSFLSDYAKNTDVATKTHNPAMTNYQAEGTGDYHLTVGDPDIDGGTSTGAYSTDFAGTTRPQGSGYDIGAYER